MAIDNTYQPDWEGIKAELEGLSPTLAQYIGRQPYAVPERYFEQLSLNIQSQISGLPEGYFEELPGRIMDRIKQESGYHLPDSASRPYQVPQNYFDQLSDRVASFRNKSERTERTVIPLFQRTWVHIAVAATLLVGILTTLFFLSRPSATDRKLARVDESELRQYVQNNIEDYELYQLVDYSNLKTEDIELTILPEVNDSTFENLKEDIDLNLLEDIWL